MNLPRVAVMMSTYNGMQYLEEQIKSILSQKGVKVELFVRDDGSSDMTVDVLRKYAQNNNIRWYRGENLKPAYSFFDLIENAPETDYYAFSDQDDIWDEDKLEVAINQMEKTQGHYKLYCSGSRLVDEGNNLIRIHKLNTKRTMNARLIYACVSGNTMVINSELRDAIRKYRPSNLIMHDAWCFKVALCLGAKLLLDSEPHISYRMHGNNVVGMELNLKERIRKFFEIVNEKNIYMQLMEIKNVYYNEIDSSILSVLLLLEKSKRHFPSRLKLAFASDIYFSSIGLDTAFKIKVLMNKF